MTWTRTLIATLALAGLALTAVPAHASPATPAAPAADTAITAVSPTITAPAGKPQPQYRYATTMIGWSCGSGYACPGVWDPTRNLYKIFDLYHCGLYKLSYWYGEGAVLNTQTGGAVVRLYFQDPNVVRYYLPPSPNHYIVDWTPVWYIRPC